MIGDSDKMGTSFISWSKDDKILKEKFKQVKKQQEGLMKFKKTTLVGLENANKKHESMT